MRRASYGLLAPFGVLITMRSKVTGTRELSEALRRLTKDRLMGLVHDLCRIAPPPGLRLVLGRHVTPNAVGKKARPDPPDHLIRDVRTFHASSLAGDSFEPFSVNSRNFMMRSAATAEWGEECAVLLRRCRAASDDKRHLQARESFDLLLDLLERIDNGEDIVFFADEGGSWEVADLDPFWPAYFTSLASTATPEEYATRVGTLLRQHGSGRQEGLLRRARKAASADQKRRLQTVAPSRHLAPE